MGHQCAVGGALGVGGLGRLPSVLLGRGLGLGGGGGGLAVVLQAHVGPVLPRRVVQDGRYAQLHLEVQKVVPGILEEQILEGRERERERGRGSSSILSIGVSGVGASLPDTDKV